MKIFYEVSHYRSFSKKYHSTLPIIKKSKSEKNRMEQRKNERELHKWEVRQDTSLKCFSQCHTLDFVFWLRTVLLHGLFSRLLYFLTRHRHDSGGKYAKGDRIIKEVFPKSDFSIHLYYLVAQPLVLLLFLFLIQCSHRLLLKRQ